MTATERLTWAHGVAARCTHGAPAACACFECIAAAFGEEERRAAAMEEALHDAIAREEASIAAATCANSACMEPRAPGGAIYCERHREEFIEFYAKRGCAR